jgi:hypothetical protein
VSLFLRRQCGRALTLPHRWGVVRAAAVESEVAKENDVADPRGHGHLGADDRQSHSDAAYYILYV